MILAIDAGNTRVKWGRYDNGQWLETGVVSHGDIATLANRQTFSDADRIMISNVAGDEIGHAIAETISDAPAPVTWVKAEKNRTGISNGYQDPTRLGSDRWCALIAAGQMLHGPTIVANAGTALTVDALTSQKEFIGGLIVPGLRMMLHALTTGTAGAHATHGEYSEFPGNTLNAIYSGAIQAAVGSIERMADLLAAREGRPANCIISGGAATVLLPHLSIPVREVKHLVLQGLVVLAEQPA